MKKLILIILGWSLGVSTLYAKTLNGFVLDNALVDPQLILSGGPPRDGIPAIDNPQFVSVDQVDYLREDDLVMGIVRDGVARAYPLRILIWHEIVNDDVKGHPITVTYCPLCGTGMVFDGKVDGNKRTFGVSGLLYQSDVLMYDRETESLWSQLGLKAVSGKEKGRKLKWLPSLQMTWSAWKAQYPQSHVLSLNTGYRRNYFASAYSAYFESDSPMFPVPKYRDELPAKSWVLGVLVGDKAKAYQITGLDKTLRMQDTVNGRTLNIAYNPDTQQPYVTDAKGVLIPSVMVFWFAWQGFYPFTDVWLKE